MNKTVLVTGGAGFIGSHIVDMLVEEGYDVRVLDNFDQQVHNGDIPDYLNDEVEYIVADVRNREQVKEALDDVDLVSHQASAVGVGQSMYKIQHYADANVTGTATLLNVLVNEDNHNVQKLVLASSFSNYGEGAYRCDDCGRVYPGERSPERLENGDWEQICTSCGKDVDPVPTKEDDPLSTSSIYGETKRSQEEMARIVGKSHGVDVVALRYFNVYGPRQSLDNPYTGVASIFSSRIKNGNPPLIYEDGEQSRDFVYVEDVARANLLALQTTVSEDVVNVGTGTPRTVRELAETLIDAYGAELEPEVTGEYRQGDIRHCYADMARAEDALGYSPEYTFEDGIKKLVRWGREQEAADRFEDAAGELEEEGLVE
ncbi:MAG: SDR family NAD(P)-dependent oxidoreductase [Candidatus Nanohaloarchaea archaeon]